MITLPFFRGDGDRLVLGGDLLGRLEDRFHDELGGPAAGDAIQGSARSGLPRPHAMALGALGLALEIEEETSTRCGIAGDVGLPGTLAGERARLRI